MTGLPTLAQALLSEMAPIGRIVEKPTPSGAVRFVLDFGRAAGRRIYSFPGPGRRPIPFYTREQAQRALDLIGLQVRSSGMSVEAVLAELRGKAAPADCAEHHIARWLEMWEAAVAAGQRSANTLREYRRYAAPGGYFAFWDGKDVRGINYGQLEDFVSYLAARGLGAKTIKNVCAAFKAVLRWLVKRGELAKVPPFPNIVVPEFAPRIIGFKEMERVLAQIPWEVRGIFLVCAYEGVRVSEARAFGLDDWDGKQLNISKAVQGAQIDAPVRANKTHAAVRREPTFPEMREWLEWRASQATSAARLRGEVLFPNPRSERSPIKRWSVTAITQQWKAACKAAGVPYVPIGQGTRHCTFTAMAASGLSERLMRAHTRHKSASSLNHYAKLAGAPPGAIVRALRPPRP